jgi:hypothetical protein
MISTVLPNWPAWIATAALLLVLAESALGVTGVSLFAADGSEGNGERD